MARKPEIQYIRYYTDGSAARQPEPQAAPGKRRLPQPQKKRRPKYILRVQPLAVCGVLMCAVLLLMMITGFSELLSARSQAAEMERYVTTLTDRNAQRREQYQAGLDLETIEKAALALGMVPVSEVPHITISVPMPESEPEATPDFWQGITTFLTGLFA